MAARPHLSEQQCAQERLRFGELHSHTMQRAQQDECVPSRRIVIGRHSLDERGLSHLRRGAPGDIAGNRQQAKT